MLHTEYRNRNITTKEHECRNSPSKLERKSKIQHYHYLWKHGRAKSILNSGHPEYKWSQLSS